jgi:hypothetical protein
MVEFLAMVLLRSLQVLIKPDHVREQFSMLRSYTKLLLAMIQKIPHQSMRQFQQLLQRQSPATLKE